MAHAAGNLRGRKTGRMAHVPRLFLTYAEAWRSDHETGHQIAVPLFITSGEKVKVDTRDSSYLGRVKS